MGRDWINTYTGTKFYPLAPRVEDINIVDIARSLSMQCRYTGHVRQFYSVAQHSIHVAERCSSVNKLWGLLHDASEAYLVDVARPIKYSSVMDGYRAAEGRLMSAIAKRYRLFGTEPAEVKEIDYRMLATEAIQLMDPHPDWFVDWADFKPYDDLKIYPMEPELAERRFLSMFAELTEGPCQHSKAS